ncbi:MAG: hypothetical protein KY459_14725 [Acidobacteria bacterium]|nr:hypothetical protein [Acidobacteriota bacterium]
MGRVARTGNWQLLLAGRAAARKLIGASRKSAVCWGVALAEMIPQRWRRVMAAGSMLIALSIAFAGLLTIRAAFG